MNSKKIVIFDMDGTLIDSGPDITCSINHVRAACYALPPLEVRAVVDAINAPQRNLASVFYATSSYEPHAKALFEEHYYEQCIRNVTLYAGIAEVLDHLRQNRFSLGIATNAPAVFAHRMMDHLGLKNHFDLIVGADDVEHPKPHPQMLERHLRHHRYDHGTDRAWMVGDNAKDMEAATAAGITSIFAGWGFSPHGSGEWNARTPAELIEIICTGG